ncbi:hypothetical protein DIPPA_27080 [Diplonema papillatum]|nr:hypothetical protein DIPPA_27080 [Diplonema papillatum]
MAANTCKYVHAYITHGSTIPPQADEKIDLLRDAIAAELAAFDPIITVPSGKPGTKNVRGRPLKTPQNECRSRPAIPQTPVVDT